MNERILVIEDNYEMQDLIKMLLEQEGYEIIPAVTGAEGLSALRGKPELSLILLDLTLPDINADAFLKKIRVENLGNQVPIVFFSAVPRLNQMELPTGVVGVIQKPFQIHDFLEAINLYKKRTHPIPIKLRKESDRDLNRVG